jgi:chemotaxis protein CheC
VDESQKDFLTEVLNIGIGRAGAVLGEIADAKVSLTVPDVVVCPVGDLPAKLDVFGENEVLTVTQPFTGILSGDAVLVLSPFSGRMLATSLFKEMLGEDGLGADLGPPVTELGNIVINYFVGSWAELFHDRFQFKVPEYESGTLHDILELRCGARIKGGVDLYAVCAEAHLEIPEFFIMASLVTIFDQKSLEMLMGSLTPAAEK